MSTKYPYTATVTISAEDRGGDTEASENPSMRVGLEAVTETLKKVHFVGTLAAPEKQATHICVTLENGLTTTARSSTAMPNSKAAGSPSNPKC